MGREQKISAEREKMFNQMYPMPSIMREVAWVILVVVSLIACCVAIIYGLSFDLQVKERQNPNHSNYDLYSSDCWNTSLDLRLENGLSRDRFEYEFKERMAMNERSFGGSDAGSWLLSLFQCLALSLVLWQPLTLYFVTWIKIWMFTWNLQMMFPKKVPALIKRVCCGPTNENKLAITLDAAHKEVVQRDSMPVGLPKLEQAQSSYHHIAHTARPRDWLSFFSDLSSVIDDTTTSIEMAGAIQEVTDDVEEGHEGGVVGTDTEPNTDLNGSFRRLDSEFFGEVLEIVEKRGIQDDDDDDDF